MFGGAPSETPVVTAPSPVKKMKMVSPALAGFVALTSENSRQHRTRTNARRRHSEDTRTRFRERDSYGIRLRSIVIHYDCGGSAGVPDRNDNLS